METPESRWKAMILWSDSCFETFLAAQAAMGRTRAQAIELLKRSWEIEDREKQAGWAEIATRTSRAR